MKKKARVHCVVKVGGQNGEVEVFQGFFPADHVPPLTPDRRADLSAFIGLMASANVKPHRGEIPRFPGAHIVVHDFSDLHPSAS